MSYPARPSSLVRVLALVVLAWIALAALTPTAQAQGEVSVAAQPAQTRVYLPLVARAGAPPPSASVLFSDALDANKELINPRNSFSNITRLYYQITVDSAESKRIRITYRLNNRPAFADDNKNAGPGPYRFTDSFFNPDGPLGSATLEIRVFVDDILLATGVAIVQ